MPDVSSEREWRCYVDDMIGFAQRVIEHTSGLDRAELKASAMTYDATVRNLELIGEAATRIPQSVYGTQRWKSPGGKSSPRAID